MYSPTENKRVCLYVFFDLVKWMSRYSEPGVKLSKMVSLYQYPEKTDRLFWSQLSEILNFDSLEYDDWCYKISKFELKSAYRSSCHYQLFFAPSCLCGVCVVFVGFRTRTEQKPLSQFAAGGLTQKIKLTLRANAEKASLGAKRLYSQWTPAAWYAYRRVQFLWGVETV